MDAIVSGAGLPLELPGLVEKADVALAPIVSSGRAAKLILRRWAKAFNRTADFVVIPTLSSPIDLQQTMLTAAQCQDAGKDYAVLIVMARKGTNALRAFRTAVEEYGAGIFDTEIPLREDFKADFGHTFRSNLNGYEDVWNELRGELR